jgi:hypothetical protein
VQCVERYTGHWGTPTSDGGILRLSTELSIDTTQTHDPEKDILEADTSNHPSTDTEPQPSTEPSRQVSDVCALPHLHLVLLLDPPHCVLRECSPTVCVLSALSHSRRNYRV